MKRILAFVLAALLALGAFALAESGDGYIGDMEVVNCESYVSLRAEPSTKAERLAKVSLGETVTNCHWYDNDFIYCEYDGQSGYILAEYLEPLDGRADIILDETRQGLRVRAEHSFVGQGEYLHVTCEDEHGSTVWVYDTKTDDVTELTLTDAFIGGLAQDPLVLVYNAEEGLTALDFASGVARWTLKRDEQHLGASLSHCLGEDGVCYIGGYYGPDPVAISGSGKVLWQAQLEGNDVFWLYELELLDENTLAAHYDYAYDGASGWFYYSTADGSFLGWERDEE